MNLSDKSSYQHSRHSSVEQIEEPANCKASDGRHSESNAFGDKRTEASQLSWQCGLGRKKEGKNTPEDAKESVG